MKTPNDDRIWTTVNIEKVETRVEAQKTLRDFD